MILYPTIELLDGKCVSLTRGRLDEPMIWHVDPDATIRGYAEAGAEICQITDFNAVSGTGSNGELIEQLIRAAGIPVQVGGGIRSREHVERWIEAGAGRVVIGTAGVTQPDLVKEAARAHPDQIVLAVDVHQGRVMSHGWEEASAFAPNDFIGEFANVPLAGIVITDIDADIGDTDGSLGMIASAALSARSPVIASGVVRTLDDISRLKYVRNISGAVIGRALFNKTVDLEEALELARPDPAERVAAFV